MKTDPVVMVFFIFLLLGVSGFRYCRRVPIPQDGSCSKVGTMVFAIDQKPPPECHMSSEPVTLIRGDAAGRVYAIDMFPLLPSGLNLNRAQEPLLTMIRGIGPATAARIVSDRDRAGKYSSVNEFVDRTGMNLAGYEGWIHVGE